MPDSTTPRLRSALADALPTPTPPGALSQAGVQVAEWPTVGCLVVRGDARDPAFLAAVKEAGGVELPLQPSTLRSGRQGAVAMWMSPDEWWLLVPRANRDAMEGALRRQLAGLHAQVVDNSGGIALLRLAGVHHVQLLRHLTAYDTSRLAVGRCVCTVFPKASVTVARGDDDGVMLLFRRSFAGWVWQLIERSARPYGLAVCTPAQLPAPLFAPLLAERVRPVLTGVFQ